MLRRITVAAVFLCAICVCSSNAARLITHIPCKPNPRFNTLTVTVSGDEMALLEDCELTHGLEFRMLAGDPMGTVQLKNVKGATGTESIRFLPAVDGGDISRLHVIVDGCNLSSSGGDLFRLSARGIYYTVVEIRNTTLMGGNKTAVLESDMIRNSTIAILNGSHVSTDGGQAASILAGFPPNTAGVAMIDRSNILVSGGSYVRSKTSSESYEAAAASISIFGNTTQAMASHATKIVRHVNIVVAGNSTVETVDSGGGVAAGIAMLRNLFNKSSVMDVSDVSIGISGGSTLKITMRHGVACLACVTVVSMFGNNTFLRAARVRITGRENSVFLTQTTSYVEDSFTLSMSIVARDMHSKAVALHITDCAVNITDGMSLDTQVLSRAHVFVASVGVVQGEGTNFTANGKAISDRLTVKGLGINIEGNGSIINVTSSIDGAAVASIILPLE